MQNTPFLDDLLLCYRDRLAWHTREGRFTYADLALKIQRAQRNFAALDAIAGSLWVIHGMNPLDAFVLHLAAMRSGLVLIQVSERLPRQALTGLLDQIPWQGLIAAQCLNLESDKEISWEDFQKSERPYCPNQVWDVERASFGIFSSGSSGTAKAILHSWSSLTSAAASTVQFYDYKAGESWLLSLDLAHIGGMQIAIRSLLAGGCCVYLSEPRNLSLALAEFKPEFVSLVPTQLWRLLDDPASIVALRDCKAILIGGAAAGLDLIRRAIDEGLKVSVGYGSTETAALLAALPPGIMPSEAGYVGEVLPHWQLRSDFETAWLQGPAAMCGFYQNGNFHKSLDAEAWMELPDRVKVEGRSLKILGRRDDVFQVAGENVSASEILASIDNLRGGADFFVLAIADRVYGQRPYLIIRSPEKPAFEDLIARWQQALPGIKRPVAILWHASHDVSKLSQAYLREALARGDLITLWKQDHGKI